MEGARVRSKGGAPKPDELARHVGVLLRGLTSQESCSAGPFLKAFAAFHVFQEPKDVKILAEGLFVATHIGARTLHFFPRQCPVLKKN